MQAQIIPIVGAAIAGLFPTILTAVVSWLNNRSLQARRTQALALAEQRITFLQDWIKAQEGLATSAQLDNMKDSVSDELSDLRSQLGDIMDDHRRTADNAEERLFLQKLFLIYIPRSAGAWVLHTLFYMTLAVTALFVLLTVTHSMDPIDTAIACLDLPGLIAAVVFRQLAVAADKRVQEQLKPTPSANPIGETPTSNASAAD